ncbi:hypothetical protein LRAMOSA02000 [Lichtheimia ramosa]|uniref:DUF1682-domain-containing protein n=1 Tax=Lichtheimia ramosa TaxID=688394 RepID=A0A077WJY1_9FUNG|nr:hypothetical protein LRAMOSA02000 [Lichtheimia ramosa]
MAQRFTGTLLSLAAIACCSVMAQDDAPETTTPPSQETSVPVVKPWTLEDFRVDIVLAASLVIFVIVLYAGSQLNTSKAKEWMGQHLEYLQSQFALVGDKADKTVLVKDGPSDFLLYVSGRRNVQYGHWWIKLKPRSDIVSWIINIVWTLTGLGVWETDRIEVTMTMDKEINGRYVLAVLPSNKAKELRDARFDLKTFTKLADAPKLSSKYSVYCESQKLAEAVMNSRVCDLINNAPDFQSLIISSMPDYEPERYKGDGDLRFELSFNMSNQTEMVQLACELPDVLGGLTITPEIKNRLRKNREEMEKKEAKRSAEERAEELAKKKADAKKAEAERIKNMSVAEQRKYDEKERARELKKMQKKRTKRM